MAQNIVIYILTDPYRPPPIIITHTDNTLLVDGDSETHEQFSPCHESHTKTHVVPEKRGVMVGSD